MTLAIVGGGEIAKRGIIPKLGGVMIGCDVTNYNGLEGALQRSRASAVVNCAGVSFPHSFVDSFCDWRREIDVNLIGSFNVAKAAIACGIDTMIFLASVAGLYGKPNHAGYSASKAGVISLVQSLAMEGYDAYAVSPGRVDTPMRERDYPGEDKRTRLEPAQVGQVVADILAGRYDPGDNIIIRKIGFDTFHRVDKGEPWRSYLRVGEPPVC